MRVTSGCGEQVDDVLNGLVGFVVGGFQFAVGPVCGIGFVVKAAVGQRATETLVEEQEQERHLARGLDRLNRPLCEPSGRWIQKASERRSGKHRAL